jgi:hypothetical protein
VFEEPVHVEVPQLGPDRFGSGGDDAAHLVERLGAGLAGRGPGDSQYPHGLDVSVPGLGLAQGVAGLGGPGRSDGVLGVRLAPPAATLTIRPVDLHDPDGFALQMPGEPGAVAASALDTHELDLAEASQPAEQTAVAGRGGLKGLHTEQATAVVQHGGDVHVEMSVDTSGDPQWHRGHQSSLRSQSVWGGTAPAGTTDRTATGLADRLLVGHSARTGGCRVSVRARPTDRYQDSSRRASAGIVGSDLARAPTRTLTPTATDLVDPTSAPTRSSLPGTDVSFRGPGSYSPGGQDGRAGDVELPMTALTRAGAPKASRQPVVLEEPAPSLHQPRLPVQHLAGAEPGLGLGSLTVG